MTKIRIAHVGGRIQASTTMNQKQSHFKIDIRKQTEPRHEMRAWARRTTRQQDKTLEQRTQRDADYL